ncbi:hypothetical protein AMJ83_10720 [candidate division WOR_3 bacterium SM23_42]|uniref:Uncharacterized protein n=1 Tax=candidate division WOR_3 bacterium SM23_42 TaxID=1703779 RepID=A0A0S8FP33_UNCW3|nr:MAG: hypothetical protein AMJ83_10720 [candidate division WOR_3 bacterium SM23_42]
MDKDALNNVAARGLPMPFSVSKTRATLVSDAAAVYKEQIGQMALVVFETISTLGEVKIERIEIVGDKRGIIMDLHGEGLIGTIFEPAEGAVPPSYWNLLKELRTKPIAAVVPSRRMALVDAAILEKIKTILQDYVGDFTDRIYQNQMKNQGINVEELHAEDVRRLILALAKATSMIVGRSKGRELSKKLTELVK